MRQDPAERSEGFEALCKALDAFASNSPGARSTPVATPGLVDYALFPWAHRLPVFEHYRREILRHPERHGGTQGVPRVVESDGGDPSERRALLGTITCGTSGGTRGRIREE